MMANLTKKGINQIDVVTLAFLIKSQFAVMTAQLDSDTGVADTTYASLWDLDLPGAGVEASGTGWSNAECYDFLLQMVTNFNGVVAKLNADGTVTDEDYAAITSTIGEGLTNFVGISQGEIITVLQTYITALATLTAKLDNDGTVNDEDYATNCNVTDTVDDTNIGN